MTEPGLWPSHFLFISVLASLFLGELTWWYTAISFYGGNTFYFRLRMPDHIQGICSHLPAETKRSLRTDSYSAVLSLVSTKQSFIKLIRDCKHKLSIEKLFNDIADFSLSSIVSPTSTLDETVLKDI